MGERDFLFYPCPPCNAGKNGAEETKGFSITKLRQCPEPKQGSSIRQSAHCRAAICSLIGAPEPKHRAGKLPKSAPRHHLEASDGKLVALQDMGADRDAVWSWREHSCEGMNEALPSELAWPVSVLATRYPSALCMRQKEETSTSRRTGFAQSEPGTYHRERRAYRNAHRETCSQLAMAMPRLWF